MLQKILVAVGVLATSSAFAAVQGSGNFRRAEAIAAAQAPSATSRVRGIANTAHFVEGVKLPSDSRILAVSHPVGRGVNVTLVNAPLDLEQPVTKMTPADAHAMGLITQREAKVMASQARGPLTGRGKLVLRNLGMSARGSYDFAQLSPRTVVEKNLVAHEIERSVTVTGSGSSAKAERYTAVGK